MRGDPKMSVNVNANTIPETLLTSFLDEIIETIVKLNDVDVDLTNAYIRKILGLKSVRSSVPHVEGSRTTLLMNGHKTFGITALYSSTSLNLLTALIASEELDEDIAILNKPLKAYLDIKIEKPIPDNWAITRKDGFIKKGELIAKGPEPFDEIRANISGHLKIAFRQIILEAKQPITTGSKIQNIFLQKHVLKAEHNRFRFVNMKEEKVKVTKITRKNLKRIGLRPRIVNIAEHVDKPTLVAGSTSVLKRRSSGTLAQLWLGYQLAFTNNKNKNKPSNEMDWNKHKTVYVTKVYDTKHQTYHDAIIGIGCWLVAINSNGYEYKIANKHTDIFGRHINSVSIDPFAFKVLQYKYPELSYAFIEYQLRMRELNLRNYFKGGDL